MYRIHYYYFEKRAPTVSYFIKKSWGQEPKHKTYHRLSKKHWAQAAQQNMLIIVYQRVGTISAT